MIPIRKPRQGDGTAIARMMRENAAYYARLAPDLFRIPDVEGADGFAGPKPGDNPETALALVAEIDGEVAGYLEARLEPPLESARWQNQPELGTTRLFINFVETAPKHQRRGVATRLVDAAEAWGRDRGASAAVCDTWIDSPLSMPFWRHRMGYVPRGVIFRKTLT